MSSVSDAVAAVGSAGRYLANGGQSSQRGSIDVGCQRQRQGTDARFRRRQNLARIASTFKPERCEIASRVAPGRTRRGQHATRQNHRIAVLRRQRLIGRDDQIPVPDNATDMPVGSDADGRQYRRGSGNLPGDRVGKLG